MKFDQETFNRVDQLSKNRLKATVSTYEVLKWLENFNEEEYDKALTVLSFLDVYTEMEIVELWEERLISLIAKISPESHIFFHAIADYGKSGTLMIYYIKKTQVFKQIELRATFIPTYLQIKHRKRANEFPKNSILVLIDDFLGSGKSFDKYYNAYILPQIKDFANIEKVYCLSLYALQKAIYYLNNRIGNVEIICELKMMAFSKWGSVFGYHKKLIPIREFCYKYGLKLFSIEDPITHKVVNHPLGYENSQALVVFPHNPPNNTLPIFWSSKTSDGYTWQPLYPRNSSIKISRAKSIRKSLAYYISLLKFSDYYLEFTTGRKELGWKTIHFVTKTDFQSFAILFLKKQKRIKPLIIQILGITETDYNENIQILISKGVLNDDESFSEFGNEIYSEVLKKIRSNKKNAERQKKDSQIKKINYLPHQFRGEAITD